MLNEALVPVCVELVAAKVYAPILSRRKVCAANQVTTPPDGVRVAVPDRVGLVAGPLLIDKVILAVACVPVLTRLLFTSRTSTTGNRFVSETEFAGDVVKVK